MSTVEKVTTEVLRILPPTGGGVIRSGIDGGVEWGVETMEPSTIHWKRSGKFVARSGQVGCGRSRRSLELGHGWAVLSTARVACSNRNTLSSPVVCAFTAFEVFGGEVVVAGLFGGLFQEFEGLSDLAAESIFGRNGRVQTLRRILRDAFGARLLSADDRRDIERGQQIRNAIVHKGATASTRDARKIVRAIARAIERVMAACKSASDARVTRIIQAIEKRGSVLELSPRGSEPS